MAAAKTNDETAIQSQRVLLNDVLVPTSTDKKNIQTNTGTKAVKSRTRVIEQYIATKRGTSEQRQWAKDLHNRILRHHAAHKTTSKYSDDKPTKGKMWALIWGQRSNTKVANNNKVQRGLVKWVSESGEWNDILPGGKVNRTMSKVQSTAPLHSTPNTYRALHSENLDNNSNSEVTQATTNNGNGKVQLNSRRKKELQRLKSLNIRMEKLALNADENILGSGNEPGKQ